MSTRHFASQSRWPFCNCTTYCGDDNDIDGDGTCKGLPDAPKRPLVEVVLIDKRTGDVV